jgi:hypothetical protein
MMNIAEHHLTGGIAWRASDGLGVGRGLSWRF